jgi:signal-transduction protein with cAMP-binding, CBS, and nucleotidyltransferase domain
MSNLNKKTVYLIVSGKAARIGEISELIHRHHEDSVIYTAPSGNVGLLKTRNANVDIVITDSEYFTSDVYHMVEHILLENKNPHQAFMIVGAPPKEEKFVDELIMGKIYFIDEDLNDIEFAQTLAKALNFTSHTEPASFHLRYLATGDVLMKEGEKAEFVYILKAGTLRAFNYVNGKKVILGNVSTGEFVGEMAYINDEPRSAFIEALSDAQLIEVPIALVDKILYKRPAWSKALLQTLSKRLKIANKAK